MINFNVRTAGWSSDQPSFGTLRDLGYLDKHYEATSLVDCHNIVWTVLVPCSINGQAYQVGEKIVWEK